MDSGPAQSHITMDRVDPNRLSAARDFDTETLNAQECERLPQKHQHEVKHIRRWLVIVRLGDATGVGGARLRPPTPDGSKGSPTKLWRTPHRIARRDGLLL
jgi:hypothetical protein